MSDANDYQTTNDMDEGQKTSQKVKNNDNQ